MTALMEDSTTLPLLSTYPPSRVKSLKRKEYPEHEALGADQYHSRSPSNAPSDEAQHKNGCTVGDDHGGTTSIHEGKGRFIKKVLGKCPITRPASRISCNLTDCSCNTKAENVAGVLLPAKRRRIKRAEEEYTEHTRLRPNLKSSNLHALEESVAHSTRCFGSCKLDQKGVLCNSCKSWIAINPEDDKTAKQTWIVNVPGQDRKRQALGNMSMANVTFGSGTVVARRDICVHVTSFGGENHSPNGIKGRQAIQDPVNIDPRVFLNACRNGDIHLVSELLDHIKAEDINYKDISDCSSTALHLATRASCPEIVEILLGRPFIDVNAGSDDGYTALIIASFDGSTRIVVLLLFKPGINVNFQTTDGWTALLAASHEGHTEIVELLLAHRRINPSATWLLLNLS